jgi:hypothetical protein
VKTNAIYRQEIMDEDGINDRTVHSIEHDGGGFTVSSEKVGVALQNFLNHATASDLAQLHVHLLYAYHRMQSEQDKLPFDDEEEDE